MIPNYRRRIRKVVKRRGSCLGSPEWLHPTLLGDIALESEASTEIVL